MNREQRRAAGQRGPSQHPGSTLDALTGHRMRGGCDDCTAYQSITEHTPGVYVLTVHHDTTCPTYRRMQ